MANTITAIMPKILAKGLISLRELATMPRVVNGDYSQDAAKFGSTIDVPIPQPQSVAAVAPSNTPPAPNSTTTATVQIVLDQWNKSDFFLTDKEMGEVDKNQSFFPMQAAESVRALANQMNADILAEYKGVFGYTGTAGTTPFAIGTGNFPNSPTDATNLRKVLNQQVCPPDLRRAVLSFDAEANALALPAFSNFEQTGDMGVKIQGQLGRKFGIDWYADNQIPTHTAGTITTGLIAKASTVQAVGTTAIVCTTAASTGACALLKGDIVLFSGDTQTYVLTADATQATAATDVTLNIYPGKKIALAGSETVTVKASHVVNLGFHRNAFAFAMRPIADMVFKGGNEILQLTDPVTGISLSLEVSRQYMQTVWTFSVLYGVKLVRPEMAVRLAG